jgi:predicted MFS family arabinose efflux permease
VPESRAPRPRRVDPVGQLLMIVVLGSLTYAIIESGAASWGSARVLAFTALAVAALVVLVPYELRRAEPLIDPRFFRSAPFTAATLVAIAAFTALGAFLFISSLYLQGDRGLSPLHAGLYMLPMAAMAFVTAPLSGRLVGRYGARFSLVSGGLALGAASFMLTGLGADTSDALLIGAFLVFGLGFGLVNPPITNTAVSGMPADQAGVAAAVASTSRIIGLTLGVAIVGALVVASNGAAGAGFGPASHPGWWLSGGCGLAAAALGLASTTPRALATAQRVAALP